MFHTVIDLCSNVDPCSQYALCMTDGLTYNCTCNEGYEGDGMGVDGCSPITPGAAPEASQTPQSNGPNAAPIGKVSSAVVGSVSIYHVIMVCVSALVVLASV